MSKGGSKLKRVLSLAVSVIFTVCLLTGMIGCGEDEEEEKEPARISQTDPSSGGEMSSNGSLLITFDNTVIEVKVNGTLADVTGSKATWKAQGLVVGSQTLEIEWTDEAGNTDSQEITLIVKEEDTVAPTVNEINIQDGATDIDTDKLNDDGIIVRFSERIDTAKSENGLVLADENGDQIVWTLKWSEGDTQVTLTAGPTNKLRSGSAYTLTVTGYLDSAGNEGESVELTFTTAGVDVPTDSLKLWLKADEGVVLEGSGVSEWQDQSGNGTDAQQANPVSQPVLEKNMLNGLPVVIFDGRDDEVSFALPVNGLENLTLFVVGAATEANVNVATHYANSSTLVWKEIGDWGTVHVTMLQEGVYFRFGTGQNQPVPVGIKYDSPIGDEFTIATAVMEGKRDRLYVKGELVYDEEKRGQAPVGNTGDIGYLGRGHEGYFPGMVAEVLVYTKTLPDDERQQVEEYLSDKYSIR